MTLGEFNIVTGSETDGISTWQSTKLSHLTGPNPEHLEDPEAQEREELVSHAVEAVILPCLEDTKEQEARKPGSPGHQEQGGHDLAGIVGAGKGQGYNS